MLSSNNLKVFVEEAWFLHHPQLHFLFVFPKERELFGVVAGEVQLSHFNLTKQMEDNLGSTKPENNKFGDFNSLYLNNVTFGCHWNGGEEERVEEEN